MRGRGGDLVFPCPAGRGSPGIGLAGETDMDIGVPKENRPGEHRVALTPSGVKVLAQRGHRVWVETGAGAAAGHPDADYQSAGATVACSSARCPR